MMDHCSVSCSLLENGDDKSELAVLLVTIHSDDKIEGGDEHDDLILVVVVFVVG